MPKYRYINIQEYPDLIPEAASWFHEKWGIPFSAYYASMKDGVINQKIVPSWYLCLDQAKIVAGMGVIENDFHQRIDLSPNICAVYTDENYRHQKIAGNLLNLVIQDLSKNGINTVYLVSDLNGFYEQYGFKYLDKVLMDDGSVSNIFIHKIGNEL